MRSIISKAIIALVCMFAFQVQCLADNDKPITISQLPAKAQTLINSNFKAKKVALAKMESGLIDKSYDVIFTNGEKVEFDRKGNWTEIDCKQSSVPTNLIPAAINTYVKTNYSGNRIIKIEKDDGMVEVKLSNGIEITFNKKYQVVDID